MRFDHGERAIAVYHAPNGDFIATDGDCIRENSHLAKGIMDTYEIQCPLHFGAFDDRTGDPSVPLACVQRKTYLPADRDGRRARSFLPIKDMKNQMQGVDQSSQFDQLLLLKAEGGPHENECGYKSSSLAR